VYPIIPQTDVEDCCFGQVLKDPYRYFEDKSHPETLAMTAAQNAYTKAYFEAQAEYRPIYDAIRKQPKDYRLSHMAEANGMICASRADRRGQIDIVSLNADYQVTGVLINDETLDHRMHVYDAKPCPGAQGIYAVMAVKHGAPRCCALIFDAGQQKVLATLDGIFDFSWSADGASVYYASAVQEEDRTVTHVAARYFWQTGQTETLYTYREECVFIQVCENQPDGCFLFVMKGYDDILALWRTSDGTVTPMNNGHGSCRFIGRRAGLCYFITNRISSMGAVVAVAAEDLHTENCLHTARAVAVNDEWLLTNACILPDGILALYESDAVSRVRLLDFDGKTRRDLALPCEYGAVTADDMLTVSDTGRLYLDFESFTIPPQVMIYELRTGLLSLACGNADPAEDVAVEQHFLPARDGKRILVYLVRPGDLAPNPETPAMMYGYGGYSVSSMPTFKNPVTEHTVVDWVRKGRIYAHCILRGGGEYGTAWHEDGMKARKKNAFTDYIDIARWLAAQGWTSPERLIATGLSNGGLLVTASATLQPDAFGCVIASVPHTDMIRFREDDRGSMYVTEYGDPQADRAMFDYMLSYSPYHNVRQGVTYPAMYLQTGEMDNNVPSYHAKKFAARMQRYANPGRPVLLTVLAHGSHNRGVGEEHDVNIARMQAFIEIFLNDAK